MSSGNTGRILGTVVGAVVGYFTGGASYLALGATAGGLIGSAFDPRQKVEGPRLDDLKVQQSQYGVGIPYLYGTERINGNVIWSTDKIEIASTQTQGGGKGGGTESTSFRYYVHMRLLLTETPRDGSEVHLVKIFQDGKIIWDASSGTSVGSAFASAENLYAGFILYQGHADQMPNAEEEAWLGAGNVPAYRGVVSMYLRAIECVGGRIPQFSFVLSTSAQVAPEVQDYASTPRPGPNFQQATAVIKNDVVWHFNQTRVPGFRDLDIHNLGIGWDRPWGAVRVAVGQEYGVLANIATPVTTNGPAAEVIIPDNAIEDFLTSTHTLHWVDLPTGAVGKIYEETVSNTVSFPYGNYTTIAAKDAIMETYAVAVVGNGLEDFALVGAGSLAKPFPGSDASISQVVQIGQHNTITYIVYWQAGSLHMASYLTETMMPIADILGPVVDEPSSTPFAAFVPGAPAFLRYCVDGITFVYYRIDTEFTELARSAIPLTPSFAQNTMWCSGTGAIVGPNDAVSTPIDAQYSFIQFNAVELEDAPVNAILADQCERVGQFNYDVSEIPDALVVRGYKLAGPASARANIDPLLVAFQIFVVTEDSQIKFRLYADTHSVADVAFEELAQSEDGQSLNPMALTRTQEVDLPRSASVTYIDPAIDYQQASETAIRQVTEATEDRIIGLPVCLPNSDIARTAAERILYAAWNAQNTRAIRVARKFAFLSPGDGLTVEFPQGTKKLWRTTSMNDTGPVIEFTLEPGDDAIFEQEGTGASGLDNLGQVVAARPPPTVLDILDMPILRDADNDAGVYAALTPLATTNWRGASLFASPDDLNFENKGTVNQGAVSGFAETALGDGSGNFGVIDHRRTFIVNVGNGELNTVTWDEIFANGTVNLAALVAQFTVDGFPDAYVEVLQFRVATDLGNGRYELSELRRGLYGTERVSYNHLVNDRFVLLTSQGMLRASLETGAIGSTQFYRAVTTGRSLDSVSSTAHTAAGYGLKPLSPINVKLDRTAADGSIAFTWGRRTRFSHNAIRSIMPLGEAFEAFDVVIFTDNSYQVVRNVYRVYTTAFTYTAADLTVDGNTQSGAIFFRIHQISDAVGRGVPFQPGAGTS